MKCTEKGCNGLIEKTRGAGVGLRISCFAMAIAYPCQKCGRLYWLDENDDFSGAVFNRRGDRAFFINGQLINRPADQSA